MCKGINGIIGGFISYVDISVIFYWIFARTQGKLITRTNSTLTPRLKTEERGYAILAQFEEGQYGCLIVEVRGLWSLLEYYIMKDNG